MVSINYSGRLGNNMFQYLMALIFSEKFKIDLITRPENLGIFFGKYFETPITYNSVCENPIIKINNDNFLDFIRMDSVPRANYIFEDFFQKKEFIDQLKYEIRTKIITNQTKNDGLILIYRLGDISGSKNELSLDYYEHCINLFSDKKVRFITSDTPNHENIKYLMSKYNLELYYDSCPLNTIDFASSFTNIILSEGTFSWWIGFMSNHNNITCNIRNHKWHGDIFETQNWIKLNFE